MTIYIDADACPVTRIAEQIARRHGVPVTLLCDIRFAESFERMIREALNDRNTVE